MTLQYCARCDRYQYYPRPICLGCGDADLREVPAAGTGIVDSFTVVHRPGPPFVLARVRLTEGPVVLTHLIDVAEPRCDLPVRLTRRDDLPVFTAIPGATDGQ